MRQVSIAAWVLSSVAIVLILSTHLWPQLLNPYRPEDYIDGPMYEPYWQSIGAPYDVYAFEALGVIAFCLHGYSQSRNRPRLALAFGLISGIAVLGLTIWIYGQALMPALERLTIDLDDPVYWAFVTAHPFLGGSAGIQGAGILYALALLLASLASRFVARFLSGIVERTGT